MSYTLIKSLEELTLNERYIIVAKNNDLAMSSLLSSNKFKNSEVSRDETNSEKINDVVGDNVYTFLLKEGSKENTYSFFYKDKYLQKSSTKNDVNVSSKLDDDCSWNISFSDGTVSIVSSSDSTRVLKFNKQNKVFSVYSTTSQNMEELELYKYSSGKEQIHFPINDGTTLSTEQSYSNKLTVDGFESSSISYTSSNESVASISGSDENFTITTKSLEGEVTLTANAFDEEGNLIATSSIKVNVIKYDYSFNDSQYAISKNGTILDPNDCKALTIFDIEDDSYYFSFVKAYEGNNTFYITSNGKYLQKSSKSNQTRVILDEEKTIWTLEKEDENYYIYCLIDGSNYYLSTKDYPAEGDFYFVNTQKTSIDLFALPSEASVSVVDTNLKNRTYNFDEAFNPTGLKVIATYSTSLGSKDIDITNKVLWNSEYVDGSISGTVIILNSVHTVTVTNLTITHFTLDRIELDSSGTSKTYVVGESVNISSLIVEAIYKDGANEKRSQIDISEVSYSPTKILKDTEEITISYKGKTASYSIDTVTSSFVEVDHLHKGFHVTFTSSINGVNYEMLDDGLSSSRYNEIPLGKAVYEIEEIREYKDSENKSIHEFRFKLIEVDGIKQTSQLYLAYDGEDGKKLTLTTLDNDSSNKTVFEYLTNNSEGFSLISKNNGKALAMNSDSKKFALNQGGNQYYDVTIYYDSSIDYD